MMFEPGDVIWVNNDVIGWPLVRRIVDHVKGNKIIYRDPSDGYVGCRLGTAHKSLTKALAHAIFIGENDV